MEHLAKLTEGMRLKFEDDELNLDDDEFEFDLDKKADDVDPEMGSDEDELDLDVGDEDDEEVDSTEDRLNDLEDKVTDILNKLSQVIAQDMTDDEMGDEEDPDELDLDVGDADAGDEEETDDGLRDDDEEVKEYEDNLPDAGNPDNSDNEVDGDFDIDTYGARGEKKAHRFKDRWGKHRIEEDEEHDIAMRKAYKAIAPAADGDDDYHYNTLSAGVGYAQANPDVPANAIAEVLADVISGAFNRD